MKKARGRKGEGRGGGEDGVAKGILHQGVQVCVPHWSYVKCELLCAQPEHHGRVLPQPLSSLLRQRSFTGGEARREGIMGVFKGAPFSLRGYLVNSFKDSTHPTRCLSVRSDPMPASSSSWCNLRFCASSSMTVLLPSSIDLSCFLAATKAACPGGMAGDMGNR